MNFCCVSKWTHLQLCVYIYIYIYVCMYVCMYIRKGFQNTKSTRGILESSEII